MQVTRTAIHDLFAGMTTGAGRWRIIRLTVQSLGHDPGKGCLTGSPDSAEYQGMGHPLLEQTVLQGADNWLLADNLGKGLGSGFSGKNKIGQGSLRVRILYSYDYSM
jgi:hypothetical protein